MKDNVIRIGLVYIDMDGVLANFFKALARLYGFQHWKDIPSSEDTVKRLSGTDFFYTLEPFETTKQLLYDVHRLTDGQWAILSTPLRGDERNSAYWKNRWLDKILDDKDLIGVYPKSRHYSHHKFLYAKNVYKKPNLLVDDRPHNLTKFIEQGGIGIRYQADESSYDKLITKLEKELL